MTIYRDDEVEVRGEDAGSRVVSTVVWAFACIVIVAMLVWGMLHMGWIFPRTTEHKVDINVTAPANR
jgi:hypothetical protein